MGRTHQSDSKTILQYLKFHSFDCLTVCEFCSKKFCEYKDVQNATDSKDLFECKIKFKKLQQSIPENRLLFTNRSINTIYGYKLIRKITGITTKKLIFLF
jgi:hypothetical protein